MVAGGGWLPPSLLVGAGAAGLGADMAAVRVPKKETQILDTPVVGCASCCQLMAMLKR